MYWNFKNPSVLKRQSIIKSYHPKKHLLPLLSWVQNKIQLVKEMLLGCFRVFKNTNTTNTLFLDVADENNVKCMRNLDFTK